MPTIQTQFQRNTRKILPIADVAFNIKLNAFVASRFIGYNNKHLLIASAYILWLKACNYKRCGDFGHLNSNRFNGQSCYFMCTQPNFDRFFFFKKIYRIRTKSIRTEKTSPNVAYIYISTNSLKIAFSQNAVFNRCHDVTCLTKIQLHFSNVLFFNIQFIVIAQWHSKLVKIHVIVQSFILNIFAVLWVVSITLRVHICACDKFPFD